MVNCIYTFILLAQLLIYTTLQLAAFCIKSESDIISQTVEQKLCDSAHTVTPPITKIRAHEATGIKSGSSTHCHIDHFKSKKYSLSAILCLRQL